MGSPRYIRIIAPAQAEGDLHLSDGVNWNTSKSVVKIIRVITAAPDWDLYILQNDNGYVADDAAIPKMQIMETGNGDADIYLDLPYEDEDASDEVHLYYIDNSGASAADIYIIGMSLDEGASGGDVSDIIEDLNDIKGTSFAKDTDSLINIRPETDKVQTVQNQTDKMHFTGDDIKATLDSETVSLSLATETQIDNIDTVTAANLNATVDSRSSHADPSSGIKGVDDKDLTQVFNNEKGTDGAYTGTPPAPADISDAVWNETSAGHVDAGKAGEQLWTDINGVLEDSHELQQLITDNKIAAQVKGMDTDTVDADAIKADAVVEIQNGLATGAEVTALDILIDRVLGLVQENNYIDTAVFDGNDNMTSCRIRVYSVAGSVGTDNDVVATYTMTATYDSGKLATYKVVKV